MLNASPPTLWVWYYLQLINKLNWWWAPTIRPLMPLIKRTLNTETDMPRKKIKWRMWACQGHTHNLWGYRNPPRKRILPPASVEIGPTDTLTISNLQNCETTSTPTCGSANCPRLQVPQPKVPYLQGQPTLKQNYLTKNLYWTCTDPPPALSCQSLLKPPVCPSRTNLVKWWQGLVRRLLLSSS